MKNFYRSTDSDGNMPRMSTKPVKKYYVKYIDDVPVCVIPYEGQDRVWNYKENVMYALVKGLYNYDGTPMKMYKGVIVVLKPLERELVS